MQCQQQHSFPLTHLWAPLHGITDVMQSVFAVDIPTEAHSSKENQLFETLLGYNLHTQCVLVRAM